MMKKSLKRIEKNAAKARFIIQHSSFITSPPLDPWKTFDNQKLWEVRARGVGNLSRLYWPSRGILNCSLQLAHLLNFLSSFFSHWSPWATGVIEIRI
jgi:hypothetical protein